jgi:hypothetical protein
LTLFWVVLGRVCNLLERRTNRSLNVDDFTGVFNMLTVGAWLLFALAYVFDFADPNFQSWRSSGYWRLRSCPSAVRLRALCRRSDTLCLVTLIVGRGVGQRVACPAAPEYRVNVVGFVDQAPRERIDGLTI